jgi:hypothetical protein
VMFCFIVLSSSPSFCDYRCPEKPAIAQLRMRSRPAIYNQRT